MSPQGTTAWPWFLAPLREALEKLTPPRGSFDPKGAWEHRYAVCVLGPERLAAGDHSRPYGALRLKRSPADAGCVLDVELNAASRGPSGLRTRVTLDCAGDRLATPQKWVLRADIIQGTDAVADLAVSEIGRVSGGTITRRGQTERTLAAPAAFTSNWSLLEAVQRLPFEGLEPLTFDLFEDLDLHKPDQRLSAAEPVTVDVADGPLRLHCFRQIGRGVLPTHYWLDDAHRLIAVTASLRGLIWTA